MKATAFSAVVLCAACAMAQEGTRQAVVPSPTGQIENPAIDATAQMKLLHQLLQEIRALKSRIDALEKQLAATTAPPAYSYGASSGGTPRSEKTWDELDHLEKSNVWKGTHNLDGTLRSSY